MNFNKQKYKGRGEKNIMEKKQYKKVVLAYSGGLDTSIIISWLKENYGCEVIAVAGDVGQADELEGLEAKALATGASKYYVADCKEEFVNDFIFPAVKANAMYEGKYLLGTSLARPIIAKKLVDIAKAEGADAICHGCTGKGNDQVRFELTIKAFAPDMDIIAPWRTWELKSREDEIEYAEARNIPLKINKETNYSKDKNLWHLSHEGLDLEDPQNEPMYDKILEMGVTPEKAPDTPTYITLTFEKGIPVALNGEKLGGQAMVKKLNEIGGANGIGIIDMVENRLVGMKSRGVYETPGGTILYKAHELLETICLDKATQHYKQGVAQKFGELFIGELELEARINSITIIDTPSDEENVCLLPNFYEDICDIIIDEEWSEYHDPTTIYMAYKLDEKLPSETLRKDMKMIITTNPQLQEELLNQEYQSCKDMKERGAEYGYLFYEVLYEDEKEALLRQQLEKEINKLFYDMSLARTIGGAIGIHYSYIDVAVFDIDGFKIALEKLNEKLSFKIYYRSFLEN